MIHKSVNYNKFYKISKLLIILLAIMVILPNILRVFNIGSPYLKSLSPYIWIAFIIYYYKFMSVPHCQGKIMHTQTITFEAIICAAVLISVQFVAGIFIDSIGETPYSTSLSGRLTNLINVFPKVIGIELIRVYLINTYFQKYRAKSVVLITILFIVAGLDNLNINNFTSLQSLLITSSKTIAPKITNNILLSLFALYGGIWPTLTYKLILTGFHWFSPILPNLQWITAGFIGIIVPTALIFIYFGKYKVKVYKMKRRLCSDRIPIFDIIVCVIAVFLIWFIVGVFPIYPSVIATGSMEPLVYPGDVILIKKLFTEGEIFSLKEGDIITFSRDNIIITHRIIEVIKDSNGNYSYRTKGDNNSKADVEPVNPNDIRGLYMGSIPKIGSLTLFFKSDKNQDLDDIEF